jgi:glycosyltransferase involved in cell wall biosynthesis
MNRLSVIVPLLNEADSLDELLRQINSVLGVDESFEVIFVDDGSTDASWSKIEDLSKLHPQVSGVRFRRNFGKSAALAAGIEQSTGDIIVTMDADLQDDPAEIPRLLQKLNDGSDVVSGWKQTRHDPWHKVYPSLVFNWMIAKLTSVKLHDHNCGLKAYRRSVFDEVQIYGEMHRFIPVLAAARGFKVCEIPVTHRPRVSGVSKYGFERFAKGFVDLLTVYFLTSFRYRPQHLLGTIGIGLFGSGSALLLILSTMWCLTRLFGDNPIHLHERAIFYFAILGMLLGVQLLSIGFIAELITAIHRPSQQLYSIIDRVGKKPTDS